MTALACKKRVETRKRHLLIKSSMVGPTLDSLARHVEIESGARYLVNEDVALSRFDGHDRYKIH
jgi:hypothetical protein